MIVTVVEGNWDSTPKIRQSGFQSDYPKLVPVLTVPGTGRSPIRRLCNHTRLSVLLPWAQEGCAFALLRFRLRMVEQF